MVASREVYNLIYGLWGDELHKVMDLVKQLRNYGVNPRSYAEH
jgi:hypothetical protein